MPTNFKQPICQRCEKEVKGAAIQARPVVLTGLVTKADDVQSYVQDTFPAEFIRDVYYCKKCWGYLTHIEDDY